MFLKRERMKRMILDGKNTVVKKNYRDIPTS